MEIPIVKPSLTNLEIDYATKALREGEIGTKSPYVKEFEEKLADYLGFKYAVYSNSGWSALLLACRVMKEKGFADIIIPTFTMIACGTAAKQVGLNIEFVDVNNRGLLQGLYTKPVMAIDIYGNMSSVRSTSFVIEDAAETFGKKDYYGDIVCFSFFYNKILTTGNGGACLTNDKELYEEMVLFRHHYYDGHSYIHEKDGYNVSQTGVMAAIGTKQLERIDEILERRREIGDRYARELSNAWKCEEYWYQPYLCDTTEEKIALKKLLEKKGIASRDFFTPLHTMPPLKEDIKAPNAQELSDKGLLLPLYPDMTKEEQDYIIKTIRELK